MSCPKCFSGHVNPGKSIGRIETIYGLKTYVAEPPAGKEPQGIIVVIPDAFGQPFVNNQILADHYAAAGPYLVYLPDFMPGGPSKVSTMRNMARLWDENGSWLTFPYYLVLTLLDFVPFMIKNRFGVAWPVVTPFFKALREDKGANLPVAAAGFCWGGIHAITLTHDRPDVKTASGRPFIDVAFAAHASGVTVPQDIENITLPFSMAVGDKDAVMNYDQVKQAQNILKAKTNLDSEVVVYPGAQHGFSIRASKVDPNSKETQQSEEAEKQAISWFQKHFAAVKRK